MPDIPVCEVCGAPVAHYVQNIKEVQPVTGPDGRVWRAWEADGPPHDYCEAHFQKPVVTYLPGTPDHEIAAQESRIALARHMADTMKKLGLSRLSF